MSLFYRTSCDELRNLVGQLERVNGQLNEEKLDLLQQLELNQDKMDSLKTTISSLEIRYSTVTKVYIMKCTLSCDRW